MASNFDDFFRGLRIVHLAIMAGVLLFMGVVYFVVGPKVTDESLYDTFRYLVPGLAIAAIFTGRFISQKMTEGLHSNTELSQKLMTYRTASIVRWALIDGVALLSIVAYMLTGNTVMILVALACVAYLFTQRPSPQAAATALQLDQSERIDIGIG